VLYIELRIGDITLKLNWLLTGFLGFFLLSAPAEAAKLQFWRFDANSNRLVFRTDEGIQPKAQLIFNPTRLVIDLPGTSLGGWPTAKRELGAVIRSVRVGQFDNQTTRIVLELAPGYSIDPQQVKFFGTSPRSWTVQLPNPQRLAIGEGEDTLDLPSEPPSSSIPVPPPANPQFESPPNQNFDRPPVRKSRVLVMIDPGHGGKDVGAIGVGGIHEADIVLAISQQVARILEQRGIQVVMTRNSDYFVDLAPRVVMAKRMDADLFVSIHANAIPRRPDVSGLETYYYGNGERLARTIHNSILQSIGLPNRGVRRARFFVLRNNPMPAVLVETGYVTSPVEAPRLTDPAYQSQMANAIARGILQYLQMN
jgi:N-acetylmuramoyl-L-alanine amidase